MKFIGETRFPDFFFPISFPYVPNANVAGPINVFGILLASFNMMRSILFTLSMLIAILSVSQEGYRTIPADKPKVFPVDTPFVDTLLTPREGDVKFTVQPRVATLLKDYANHEHSQNGYRVQIFLGDRNTAESTKRSFLQRHPDVPAYLSWLAPNFRLRVGDLHTRLEAEHLLHELKTTYPGSYIVPDEVEMGRD